MMKLDNIVVYGEECKMFNECFRTDVLNNEITR